MATERDTKNEHEATAPNLEREGNRPRSEKRAHRGIFQNSQTTTNNRRKNEVLYFVPVQSTNFFIGINLSG